MGQGGVWFEMPYRVRCTTCEDVVAKGVGFNSQQWRSKFYLVGWFFSVPVYEVHLKCHQCGSGMVLRTDLECADYTLVAGCKKDMTGTEGLEEALRQESIEKLNQIWADDYGLNQLLRKRFREEREKTRHCHFAMARYRRPLPRKQLRIRKQSIFS